MDWNIVLSASVPLATALGLAMRARYRHKSVTAIVNAWSSDRNFDLPAAIAALHGRSTPPAIRQGSESPADHVLESQRVD